MCRAVAAACTVIVTDVISRVGENTSRVVRTTMGVMMMCAALGGR
jgi:hypothetical protein